MAIDADTLNMIGPPASAYNAVNATGHLLHPADGDGGAEALLYFHTAFIPKVIMVFNATAATTDDGFWLETMGDFEHFNWADGAFSALSGFTPAHGTVPNGVYYIREGVAAASTGSTADRIIGWGVDSETLGGDEDDVDYVCCGVQAQRGLLDDGPGAPPR